MLSRGMAEGRKSFFRFFPVTKDKTGLCTDEVLSHVNLLQSKSSSCIPNLDEFLMDLQMPDKFGFNVEGRSTVAMDQSRRSSCFTLGQPRGDLPKAEGDTAAQAVVHSLAGKLAALQDAGRARPASLACSMLTKDAGTITEVCSGGELPEVEIISLLHENIPKYKLRADSLTAFSGYENQDWFIPSPALKVEDIDLKLSPDQIRETLNYFILCSNRVSQMTKTYNDIEAVTRLLEEKEKDLELTARIGKELLTHNNKLEASVQSLAAELKAAKDEITQLAHEVFKKSELIQVLTNEVDDTDGGGESSPTGKGVEIMRRRIGGLEEENRSLRSQAERLLFDTDAVEEREARLVRDVSAQLANASLEVYGMGDELARTKEEFQSQRDLLESTTAKLQSTEQKLYQVTVEHEQALALLDITRENQNSLAAELAEFKERYAEVLALLREAQEQAKVARSRTTPLARSTPLIPPRPVASLMPHVALAAGIPQHDSLQSELESSLYSDFSMDSGIGEKSQPFKRVFETVRCASKAVAQGLEKNNKMATCDTTGSGTGPLFSSGWGGTTTSSYPWAGPRMSICSSDSAMGDNASITSSFGDYEELYPGNPSMGVPGVPGAADLEAALRRLTPAEIMARRAKLGSNQYYDYDGGRSSPISSLPFGLRTPDSIMSTGVISGSSSSGRMGSGSWRLPDRLQIVKPMEGSQTLHQWAQLATPTMSGLLEDRPGVQIRGGRTAGDLGIHMYSIHDVEEDDEYPGKRFDNSSHVYTFTNSMVMHPDDGSMAGSMAGSRVSSVAGSMMGSRTSSVAGSLWGSARGSEVPSACSTRPHSPTLSRRNSTSTFSTHLGLANILNERGIKAAGVPQTSDEYTPTATPCNSPQLGSPSSPPGSPNEYGYTSHLPPLSCLISSGAEMLRRTFSPLPSQSKKSDKRVSGELSIANRVERIGLESIGSGSLALQATGALYTRRGQQSPMAQLTCLKAAMRQGNMHQALAEVAEHVTDKIVETVAAPLGVPGKPGTGALGAHLERNKRKPRPRQDLGKVTTTRPDLGSVNKPPEKQASSSFSTLGTLSSLLFGRKGGLL